MRFSDEEIRRYARQMVLREVGGVGQERLRAATATAKSELEALYLAAAGVGTVFVPTAAIAEAVRALNPLVRVELAAGAGADVDEPGDGEADPGASSAEAAAARALATVREVLTP